MNAKASQQASTASVTVHASPVKSTLSNHTLWWMVLAEILLFIFHPVQKVLWLYLLVGVCIVWRIASLKKWMPLPRPALRRVFVLLSCVGVAISYGMVFQIHSGVALFFAAFALKLLEIEKTRDCYFWCYLSFFLIASMFLFNTTILTALSGVIVLVITITVLFSLNMPGKPWAWQQSLAPLRLVLLSVPFMLVLFVLFPRMTPLWRLAQQNQALSGLSDSMAPGEIAKVANSSEIAFRASFAEDPHHVEIPPNQLYWRSVVLTFFDGQRWSTIYRPERSLLPKGTKHDIADDHETLRYSIMAEPNYQKLLYLLDYPLTSPDTDFTKESLARANEPLLGRLRYQAQSALLDAWPQSLSELEKQRYLQLPQYVNPQSRALARNMFVDSEQDAQRFVDSLLRYIQTEPFYYTLEPGSLIRRDSVDEFFFQTKEGFCAHYAGAMTFMLRSIGVPARVVLGYQGGAYNAIGRYYTIRQLDAHAWVEYWTVDQGWVRVDPTAAVAPYRVQNGMQSLLDNGDLSLSVDNRRLYSSEWMQVPWLKQFTLQFEHLNYLWHQWVLEYNYETQSVFLKRLLGEDTSIKLSLLLGSFILVFAAAILLLYSYRGGSRHSIQHAYINYCNKLSRYGIPHRYDHEGAVSYLHRTLSLLPLSAQMHHKAATQVFVEYVYNTSNDFKHQNTLPPPINWIKSIVRQMLRFTLSHQVDVNRPDQVALMEFKHHTRLVLGDVKNACKKNDD